MRVYGYNVDAKHRPFGFQGKVDLRNHMGMQYICAYSDGHICTEEGNFHNPVKMPTGKHVNPQNNFPPASPGVYATSKRPIFDIDINSLNIHIP